MSERIRPWLVLDMDEGVIRREPTRRAAVAWMLEHCGGRVLSRHTYGPGAYEYHVGDPAEGNAVCYFVERLARAVRSGWDWWFEIPDAYPYPDRPHESDPDVDRDLLIKELTRRARAAR